MPKPPSCRCPIMLQICQIRNIFLCWSKRRQWVILRRKLSVECLYCPRVYVSKYAWSHPPFPNPKLIVSFLYLHPLLSEGIEKLSFYSLNSSEKQRDGRIVVHMPLLSKLVITNMHVAVFLGKKLWPLFLPITHLTELNGIWLCKTELSFKGHSYSIQKLNKFNGRQRAAF